MKLNLALWRESLEELSRRKLRTLLTLLGLIFGVGAIVSMLAVGEGSRLEALRLIEGLGLKNIIIEPKLQDAELQKETRARSLGLTLEDARAALASVPGAVAFAAEKKVKSYAIFSDRGQVEAEISGVTPSFFELTSLRVAHGRVINQTDDDQLNSVAVLGHQAALSLFPQAKNIEAEVVGQWVKLNHAWFEIVGILADRDLSAKSFEGVQLGAESNRVFVPLSSAKIRFRFQPLEDQIDRVLLKVSEPEQLGAGARVLNALFEQRHAGAEDFSLIVPQQLFQQHQKTQRIFRIVMAAIAGVSLLVGGIGIMNIMLANVLERRREIGLLRAVGARERDVVMQFLRETAVICILGALLGVVFGIIVAYLIAWLAGWHVAWSPLSIFGAALFCAAVGIVFGVYPAKQAAKLDPISALRGE